MDAETTHLLEPFTRTSPFGVRFWDVARREVVRSGLSLTVAEVGNPRRPVTAFANASGVWILRDLKLRDEDGDDFEFGDGRDAFWSRWPAPVKQFDLTVSDRERRFLPFHFVCGAPQRGFARCGCGTTSPPGEGSVPDDAVPVYPAASRGVPAGMAVVRAELAEPGARSPLEGDTPRPASWAFVEALIDGRVVGASFADALGRVAVMFPWPAPVAEALLSPPSPPAASGATALVHQRWRVRLRAYYDRLAAGAPPELCAVLAQGPARLIGRLPDESLVDSELAYGAELVVRSLDDQSPPARASSLFITPGP